MFKKCTHNAKNDAFVSKCFKMYKTVKFYMKMTLLYQTVRKVRKQFKTCAFVSKCSKMYKTVKLYMKMALLYQNVSKHAKRSVVFDKNHTTYTKYKQAFETGTLSHQHI